MGSKLYANIFMYKLEKRPNLLKAFILLLFHKWLFWYYGHTQMTDLIEFLQTLNNFHLAIEFTSETSTNKITF